MRLLSCLLALPLAAQPPAAPPPTAQPPVAQPAVAPPPAWEYAPSVISLPIRVHLDSVFREAEKAAPRVPPGVETWTPLPDSPQGPAQVRFNLYRDPLQFNLRGRRLTVKATVHYWLQVGLGVGGYVRPVVSCGLGAEGHREARLGVEAEFGITPAWGVNLKVAPLEPEGLNPCQVSFLKYDITGKVLGGMKENLLKATADMERQVSSSALLREKAEVAWQQVREPLAISEGVWLVLNPERVRLGPWTSDGRTLTITPEIQARPQVLLGPRPAGEKRALPPLESSPLPLPPGFRVRLEGVLPFEHATAQLRRQVAGKTFETDKGTFQVLEATVRAQGDKALLEVTIKGRVDGRLSLAGKPVFDAASGTLKLEGLDYTLESKSWITKFGEWLFRSTLRKTLAEKADWFLDRSFQDVKTQVQQGLNRPLAPGMALKGRLDTLRLGTLRILEDRFTVEAFLEGEAGVEVGDS